MAQRPKPPTDPVPPPPALINDFIKDGKEIPARTIVPGTVITAENYQEVMGGGS